VDQPLHCCDGEAFRRWCKPVDETATVLVCGAAGAAGAAGQQRLFVNKTHMGKLLSGTAPPPAGASPSSHGGSWCRSRFHTAASYNIKKRHASRPPELPPSPHPSHG
jgi:hypothetical protein